MLCICTTLYMLIGFLAHSIGHLTFDFLEIGNVAIVHNCMDAERKGMIICVTYTTSCRSSDMGEDNFTACIAADGAEVGVMERWLDRFI